jgi:ADP-heptose:LPS heptosyltransferase
LKRVSVVISTDSGPRHLSNAAGVPVVFIRNLSFNKREAGVYCETEYDMAPDVESLAPKDQMYWLRQTTPESVAAKALEILNG